ncbi:hypothetical protein FB451DRAFT_1376979 [Mycena latifolia]|nr:hypothetical protein FB451DRAFT_1376979 [Mycena latifolia]
MALTRQPGRSLPADTLKLAGPTSTLYSWCMNRDTNSLHGTPSLGLPKVDLSLLDDPTSISFPEEHASEFSPVVWTGLQYSHVSDFFLVAQCIHFGPWLEIHKNFVFYTLEVLRLFNGPMTEIRDLSKQWAEWDMLCSLGNYQSVVNTLFGYLNNKISSRVGRTVAKKISEQLSQDVSAVQRRLVSLLRNEQNYRRFLACRGSFAQQLLDLIQDLLDSTCDSRSKPLLSKALIRLSRASGLHPTCFALSGLEKVGEQVAAGGFADIWRGLVERQNVAVKIMRLFRDVDIKAGLKALSRFAMDGKRGRFGVFKERSCGYGPFIPDFGCRHGPRVFAQRVYSAWRSQGSNILVTPSRRACIADFGLSSIADSMTMCFTHSTTSPQTGTMRWQAPELLRGESVSDARSDVYAFACVCYEILSGKIPFYDIPEPARLVGLIGAKNAQSHGTDWDETSSSRFRRSLQDCPLLPSVVQIQRIIALDDIVEEQLDNIADAPEYTRVIIPRSQDPISNSVDSSFYPYTPNDVRHRRRAMGAQLKVLQGLFTRNPRPDAARRKALAAQLNMTPRSIEIWFQNRRASEKWKASKLPASLVTKDINHPPPSH